MAKLKYKQVGDIIEETYADTDNCLGIWKFFQPRMGKISSVDCDGEKTTITGSALTLKMRGCNCGYGGYGPHGTAKILRDLGVDAEKAEALIHQSPMKVAIDHGSEKYSKRDLACPIPTLNKSKLKETANKVLNAYEQKEGVLPKLPLTERDKFRWGWQSPTAKVRENYFKELAKQENEGLGKSVWDDGTKVSAARFKTAVFSLEAGWNNSPCLVPGARLQETATCLHQGELKHGCINLSEKLKPPSQIETDGLLAEEVFTQETLKRMCSSDTKCELYRGWGGEIKGEMPTRPLSSWTFDENWARHVALCKGQGVPSEQRACIPGFVIKKNIAIDNIVAFSLAAGVDNAEMEAIVYNDKDSIEIQSKDIVFSTGVKEQSTPALSTLPKPEVHWEVVNHKWVKV